jgi:nitric oxide reductase subunit C
VRHREVTVRLDGRLVIGLGLAVLVLGATSASAVDVQAAYDKKCKLCHSIKGEGGKQAEKGGPLDGVGAKRDKAWLEAYLKDPKSKMPDAKMPKLKYEADELAAFVDMMLGLK